MGVLFLRFSISGQILLLLLVLTNVTDAGDSQPTTAIAPPLNATGNHKEDNSSNASSSTANNVTTTPQNPLTTKDVSENSTLGPTQNNATVTSATQTNTTQNPRTLTEFSTVNISTTAITSSVNSTKLATSGVNPVTERTTLTIITQNSTISSAESKGLNNSDKSLTIFFSTLLGLIVLVILAQLVYKFSRSKERSVQYTHRRLQNEETGEQFAVPDDTLVISGGLYDGPQIYNPTMTVQTEDESQTDGYGFGSIPTQFRLEFLREDQD